MRKISTAENNVISFARYYFKTKFPTFRFPNSRKRKTNHQLLLQHDSTKLVWKFSIRGNTRFAQKLNHQKNILIFFLPKCKSICLLCRQSEPYTQQQLKNINLNHSKLNGISNNLKKTFENFCFRVKLVIVTTTDNFLARRSQ